MRCIHTADWHLGNRMHEIDRSREFDAFLGWLREEIVQKQADCLIVAGDVYDVANPPNEAKKAYCAFLASLVGSCCRNVIIVGGNHDSGSLLDTEKDIFAALNIRVVGSLSNVEPEDLVFELTGEGGQVIGIAAAVPYAREIELRSYFDGTEDDGKLCDAAYGTLYRKVWEAAERKRAGRDIPVIATGHLYAASLEGRFSGCRDTGSFDDGTRAIDILGNLGLVSASVFPPDFDYIALGHVHYTTMVAKNPKIRYSGSPFVLGFDEAALPRYVLCVDCEKGKTGVEKLEVPSFVRYRRLEGSISHVREELELLAKETDDGRPCYLELYYQRGIGDSSLAELEAAVEKLPPHISVVSWKLAEAKGAALREGFDLDDRELKNLQDDEIFTSLILENSRLPVPIPEGADEETAKKIRDEWLAAYLPLFLQLAREVESEGDGE